MHRPSSPTVHMWNKHRQTGCTAFAVTMTADAGVVGGGWLRVDAWKRGSEREKGPGC